MAYYGFEHRYGSNIVDERGDSIGTLYVFTSRIARDRWLDDGNPYINNRNARTAMSSKQAAKFRRASAAVERRDAAEPA